MGSEMTEKRWYPVLFMLVASLLFSSVIIGFSIATERQVKANEKIAVERAILEVLYGKTDTGLSGKEIHRQFNEKVAAPDESSAGAYVLKENGEVKAYAVPFEGRGFWAYIKGFIGVAEDRKTVTGIAFYEQSETPGLGAEISHPPFRGQFKGKVMASDKRRPLQFKRPGEALDEASVHAVTGATQTCTRLQRIVNEALANWREKMK